MSIKLWCEKHEIAYRRYSYWYKKLQNIPKRWAKVTVPHNEVKDNEISLHSRKRTIVVADGSFGNLFLFCDKNSNRMKGFG